MPTAKGHWRWRIQQRGEFTFRAQFKGGWNPFWRTVTHGEGSWEKIYQSAEEAKKDVIRFLHQLEKERLWRLTSWEVVEEGRYPE